MKCNQSGKLEQKRGVWGDSWTEDGTQCRGATEAAVVCLAATSHQQEWEITLVFLARNGSCVILSFPRNSTFFRSPGKLEAFLVHLFKAKTLARDEKLPEMAVPPRGRGVGDGNILSFFCSCHFSALRAKIIPRCDAAGAGLLVHKESWCRAQREGKCEGEIGKRFIGEDLFKEWEGVSLRMPTRWGTCPLPLDSLRTHAFIKISQKC